MRDAASTELKEGEMNPTSRRYAAIPRKQMPNELVSQPGQVKVQKISVPELRLVIIDQPGGRIFIGREFSSFEDALNEIRLQMGYPAHPGNGNHDR
jgi:hypothetical protein